MPQENKKADIKDESTPPRVESEHDQSHRDLADKQQVESYLQKKAAVTQSDLRAFQDYLNEKAKATPAPKDTPRRQTKLKDDPPRQMEFSRRGLLKAVAGTAVV